MHAYRKLTMIQLALETCSVAVNRISHEQNGELRDLHAKMIILGNDEWQMLLIGSSNFTTAGLGAIAGRGNCEANLVYRMRTSDSDFTVSITFGPKSATAS
jgi:hypothetical protein